METTQLYYITLVTVTDGHTSDLTVGFDDTEAAYAAFDKACAFAEAVGALHCDLWWGDTGEVVASLASDEEDEDWDDAAWHDTCDDPDPDDPDYEPDFDEADLECGFNPYEGCYDWDC